MNDRDPRVTPAVGDVLRINGATREVTAVYDNGRNIFYHSGKGYGKVFLTGDKAWQKWAAKATVVTKAS